MRFELLSWIEDFFLTLIPKNTNFENVIFFSLPIQILIATRLFLSQGMWWSVPEALPQLCNSRIFYLCSQVLQQFMQGKVKSLPPDVFKDKWQTFGRNNLVLFHSVSQQTVIYHCSSILSNCLALISHFLHYLIRKFDATEGNQRSEYWLW